jgi:hypothetical protein
MESRKTHLEAKLARLEASLQRNAQREPQLALQLRLAISTTKEELQELRSQRRTLEEGQQRKRLRTVKEKHLF